MAKNQNNILKNHKILSILVSRDGLYFCISKNKQEITHFKQQLFSSPKSPEELLKEMRSVLDYSFSEEDLKNIQDIQVIYAHPLFALVPRPYFIEEKLSDYLKFNARLMSTDELNYDRLQHINANLVYVPFTNINNYLIDKFGEFHYSHSVSLFLDQCLLKEHKAEESLFINVFHTHFEVCIFKGEELILCNSYDYFSAEDFIYYVLFLVEELQLDPEEVQVYASGEINEEDALYNYLYTYIRKVDFLTMPKNLLIKDEHLKEAEPHRYQFLLNAITQ